MFTLIWGKISILTNIFQRGWNHQLDNVILFHAVLGKDGKFVIFQPDIYIYVYVPHKIVDSDCWSEVFLWTMELLHYISVFVVIYATRFFVEEIILLSSNHG